MGSLKPTGQISLAPPSFQARALSEPSLSTFAPTQSKGGTVDSINLPLAGVVILEAAILAHKFPVRCIQTEEPILFNGVSYNMITSPNTGRIWLDRNIYICSYPIKRWHCRLNKFTACWGDTRS
jgi:hypothetical protein